MTHRPTRALAALAALLLALATGCSDGGSDDAAGGTNAGGEAEVVADEGAGDADAAAGDDDEGSSSDVTDDDRERIARALQGTVGADGYEIDGTTLTYTFSDGSSQDRSADVHCAVMPTLQGAFDLVVLSFPDGTHECGIASFGG